MRFKYIGEHATVAFGVSFAPGETQDVSNPIAQQKLQGNQFFELVEDDQPTEANDQDEKPMAPSKPTRKKK